MNEIYKIQTRWILILKKSKLLALIYFISWVNA